MADDDSPSPNQSPPQESSPTPPSSDSSSSSPPPSDQSSSPSPPSPPPSGGNNEGNNDGNASSSPPPQNSSPDGGTPPSSPPPPTPSDQSQPPPSGDNNGGGSSPNPQTPPSGGSSTPSVPGGGGQQQVPSPPGAHNTPNVNSPPGLPHQSTPFTDGSSLSPQGAPASSSSTSNLAPIVGGVVGVGVVVVLLCIICTMCMRKKKRKQPGGGMPPYGWESGPNTQGNPGNASNQYWQSSPQDHAVRIPPASGGWPPPAHDSGPHHSSGPTNVTMSPLEPSPSLTLGFNKSTFSYEELATATNGFDKSRMLGQGGFGYVHKGLLPNGKEIAVKSLKTGSGQGEREFQAEVEIISRVHHRHLVSLVGYCIAGGQRMLVYEFVPNDTLEHHLHKKGDPPLDFSTRLRIALGSAKGLAYLHEDCHPRIIHRDIKASNILLDENYEAMVADFGLAKLTTDTNTHVSTRVMGTFGYLAPEYASSGKLTEKSDVFSYGVMLLELITGRRPVDPNMKYMEDSLVDWSRPLLAKALETGNYDELADPQMERNYNHHEMQRMVACAAASIRHSAKKRPKMSQIVRALEGDVSLEDLNEGAKPGQTLNSSDGGSDYDSRQYSVDLKKFRQMAFATQDFASSEYGGTTSEYGLNPSTSSSDNSREVNSKRLP